jgi:hypothetical protein
VKKNHQRVTIILADIFFLSIWLIPASVPAAPTTADQAQRVVRGWLARDSRPLDAIMGRQVKEVQAFQGQTGIAYYVVYLEPQSLVIVPGDDLVEPIIAFAPQGQYDPSGANPLGAWVTRDVPQRLALVRAAAAQAQTEKVPFQPQGAQAQAWSKWQSLLNQGTEAGLLENRGQESGLPTVSDPRVDPLVATRWDQDVVTIGTAVKACYNFYTPPYDPGSVSNYPCGCVATAMAQIMRHHKHPTDKVGTPEFTIKVDGRDKQEKLRGGDGKGGAYDWGNMVAEPKTGANDVQLQAIGALIHDAATAIKMEYTKESSAANTSDVRLALVNTFNYKNVIDGGAETGIPNANLKAMINANLDASLPVQLGIINMSDPKNGHDVVADGYGYNLSTLYHHLNMGWNGLEDAWYNLPNVDTKTQGTYNLVLECLYNIYTSGAGEIISGRVMAGGKALEGTTVTATRNGGGTYAATTNFRGIYALA